MSSKSAQEYVKEYLKRMVSLNKAIEGQSSHTFSEIKKFHLKIIDEIKKGYGDISAKELRELNSYLQNQIMEYSTTQIQPDINETFNEIVVKEVEWVSSNLTLFSGSKANILNPTSVANRALKKTYQGHTFKFWFNGNTREQTTGIENMLRQGYVAGSTTDEVVTQISGLLNRVDNDLKTLTRSYLQHAAVESREETYNANQDVILGYYWLSTLDSRTTPHICGIRDGKFYNKDHEPVGHGLPWGDGPGRIHFNCRSSYMPKIKGVPDVREMLTRPAIGAGKNYEKGDNTNSRGKVRKFTKDAKEKGIYSVKQVRGTTDFESYLRSQPIDFISDVLKNNSQAQAFKKGDLSLYQIATSGSKSDINLL